MPVPASRLANIPSSAISMMSRVAHQYGAINLASGYPDFDPPEELLAAAERALWRGYNQYAAPAGSARLRRALAVKQSRLMGIDIDPDEHITITCGSTEAVVVSLAALCNPGDKILIFSPFYEVYTAGALLLDLEVTFVPLHPPQFVFDPGELRRAFQQGPKAALLCNPHNPSGRVFSRDELLVIASLAQEFDSFMIVDEVYEHIVFDPHQHTYLASLPGMFERTLTCGSLSKTYSITGWRLGYVIAPPEVSREVLKVHDYTTLCAPAPLQEAAASALAFPEAYYQDLRAAYSRRRSILLSYLERACLSYIPPQGTYFVMVDIQRFGFADDTDFCLWMAKEVGVAAVPGSSFFPNPVNNLIRLNFAKREETLVEAGERLQALKTAASQVAR